MDSGMKHRTHIHDMLSGHLFALWRGGDCMTLDGKMAHSPGSNFQGVFNQIEVDDLFPSVLHVCLYTILILNLPTL